MIRSVLQFFPFCWATSLTLYLQHLIDSWKSWITTDPPAAVPTLSKESITCFYTFNTSYSKKELDFQLTNISVHGKLALRILHFKLLSGLKISWAHFHLEIGTWYNVQELRDLYSENYNFRDREKIRRDMLKCVWTGNPVISSSTLSDFYHIFMCTSYKAFSLFWKCNSDESISIPNF